MHLCPRPLGTATGGFVVGFVRSGRPNSGRFRAGPQRAYDGPLAATYPSPYDSDEAATRAFVVVSAS